MATNWWKILVLEILITTVICSTELELVDDSKLSNENMVWLFKQFLENINNQHAVNKNDKVENSYQPSSLTSTNGKYIVKYTENESENEDENLKNSDLYEKRGEKNNRLCSFKLCKKSYEDNYDNFIRYVTRRYYNPQQF